MLPKIDVPIYELKLLSQKDKIRFRPFTVKEEKLFLMAIESANAETVVNTVKQVVNNCILDNIDVDSLPIFDLEYIFLNLRAKSVGEIVELKYKCNNDVIKDDKEEKCGNLITFELNLNDIKPEKNEQHNELIYITEKLGICFKYPNFKLSEKYEGKSEAEMVLGLIIDCIDYIFDEDNIYYAKDTTREELIEFVDSLQTKDFEKIKVFFDTMPKLQKKLNFKCNGCGYQEEINLEGIQNFFV